MKNIKTFEDACNALGISAASVPDLSAFPEDHSVSIGAFYKLRIIAQALNDGWQPNWDKGSEYKWVPWFIMSGSGLSFYVADYWYTNTDVGSRLCFKSRELAEYAATQFIDLYKEYLKN